LSWAKSKWHRIALLIMGAMSYVHASEPTQLKSFTELIAALNSGAEARLVRYCGKCKLILPSGEEVSAPDAIGGMPIATYEYFVPGVVGNKSAFVVCSENKLIANPKGKGYVYNYEKVKISADNSVKVTAQYLNAHNFKVQMSEDFFSVINNGRNYGAVFIYYRN